MLRLFQVRGCPYAHRARIALNEKQLAYDVVYYEPKNRPAELAALPPEAKSPTLFDGDDRIWESLVVIEYLDDKYPQPALMPKDPAARAQVRLLIKEIDAKVLPTLGPVVMELVYKPAGVPRDDAKVHEGIARFKDAVSSWDARLAGKPFLTGDAFTLADIVLYTPFVSIANLLGADQMPDAAPNLRAWRDRVAARPSTPYPLQP